MTGSHPIRAAAAASAGVFPARRRARWEAVGIAAVAMSGAALAALPRESRVSFDAQVQWRALAIEPLAQGGTTGLRMEARDSVAPIDAAPRRAHPVALPEKQAVAPVPASGPLRIRGRVADGLYWSLRSAGASAQAAAQYLSALASEIDVGGDVQSGDSFDLVVGSGGALLYAGLDRQLDRDLQLVCWTAAGGRSQWIDAAGESAPQPSAEGMILPAAGHITSYFGNRVHPILRFTRFHAGLDIGASWGSPIVAAGDGQVVGAGWAGGYGRQVRIAHAGGLVSSYSHMSQTAVAPGTFVQRGQVIGYVGSSGFSTGPHLHFEVRQGGAPINPLSARIVGVPRVDPALAGAVKARLKALLSVGSRRSA